MVDFDKLGFASCSFKLAVKKSNQIKLNSKTVCFFNDTPSKYWPISLRRVSN